MTNVQMTNDQIGFHRLTFIGHWCLVIGHSLS
jgi:hypothetical protein